MEQHGGAAGGQEHDGVISSSGELLSG
jgi:hypothetical protein